MDAQDLKEIVAEARKQLEGIRDAVTVNLANAEERAFDPAELDQEMKTYGHLYDENCTSPTCTKNRRMYQTAVAQATAQAPVQGGA